MPRTLLNMLDVFYMSWLSDRFSYPEQCWTCRVGLFYVLCRLHYSEMSGRAQNYVGHDVLDFFYVPCRLRCSGMSFHIQNIVGHAVLDFLYSLCRLREYAYPEPCWTCRFGLFYVRCRSTWLTEYCIGPCPGLIRRRRKANAGE